MPAFCAIDLGTTSNSAIALPACEGVRVVELEPGQSDHADSGVACGGRPGGARAGAAPLRSRGGSRLRRGHRGPLMRSMKSILGSTLAQQSTEVGAGRSVRYLDVVSGTLRDLKRAAEHDAGHGLTRLVPGRAVFFVDDDAQRDAGAQAVLVQAARKAGFADIHLQYEPIAAVLNYETTLQPGQRVRVAGVGGGTSDFPLVRGDRSASVAGGLGMHALRLFGAAS